MNNKTNTPDCSITFLNRVFKLPVLGAPITGARTNLGGAITEYDYAMETTSAAKMAGTISMLADGVTPDKYIIAMEAISHFGGIFIAKPRLDHKEIIKRAKTALDSGAFAWGVDIDAVGIATAKNRDIQLSYKTEKELNELKESVRLPFIIKGVMDTEGAKKACEAGADAIVVSNHGGRIPEPLPSTISVLEEISKYVNKFYPHVTVLADGGVRSGEDVFKMLAKGAKAVLVGRPLAISTVAFGRFGAYSMFENMAKELKTVMANLNIAGLSEMNSSFLLET